MRLIILIIFLLTGSLVSGHTLHLSITNISIEDKEIQVNIKTFRDDWEIAYFHYFSRMIDFTVPANREIPWFRNYLEESFRLSTDSNSPQFKLEVDTVIVNEDNMTIEMHTELREEPNSLYIYNTILTDIFPDQTNLVIIGFRNKESGIKFDFIKHAEEISLR
ncbi:MAG TPA: hypothetical protein ENN61_03365 [Bacteroidaceae bacterium]|nr:hypothetical protein [Bacteroidaceae bacterium]